MSAKAEKFTEKALPYYVKKFQRRVFRRVVEFRVLTDNLESDLGRVKPKVTSMLGIPEAIVEGVEVKDHLEKACLTGLKAEFELFFTIYCNLVLDHLLREIEALGSVPDKHKGILTVVQDKKQFFSAFIGAGLQDAREIFIAQAVPSHGLDRLTKLLDDCGWDAVKGLDAHGGDVLGPSFEGVVQSPWDQLQTAFQVRHAIEHAFSHVGRQFFTKTKTIWRGSSWPRGQAEAAQAPRPAQRPPRSSRQRGQSSEPGLKSRASPKPSKSADSWLMKSS